MTPAELAAKFEAPRPLKTNAPVPTTGTATKLPPQPVTLDEIRELAARMQPVKPIVVRGAPFPGGVRTYTRPAQVRDLAPEDAWNPKNTRGWF